MRGPPRTEFVKTSIPTSHLNFCVFACSNTPGLDSLAQYLDCPSLLGLIEAHIPGGPSSRLAWLGCSLEGKALCPQHSWRICTALSGI